MYIKVFKYLLAEYYHDNKGRLQKKLVKDIFKEEKEKSNNMVVKMKNMKNKS